MRAESDSVEGKIKLCVKTLKYLRKSKGCSQEAMAQECQALRLRISISSIKRAESGRSVNYRTARELSKYFEVDISQLHIASESQPIQEQTPQKKPSALDDFHIPITVVENRKAAVLFISVNYPSYRGDAKQLLCQCEEIARTYGGHVDQRLSNSLLILFKSDKHDHGPIKCVAAGLDIEHQLKSYAPQNIRYCGSLHLVTMQRKPSIQPLDLEQPNLMEFDDLDSIFVSNIPSEHNQIVVSDAIKRATEESYHFQPLITKQEAESQWKISGRRNYENTTHTPLIGRELELQEFSALLDLCETTSQAHVLTIFGEAGIGKSRLSSEFRQISRDRGWQCFHYEIDKISASSISHLCHEVVRQYQFHYRSSSMVTSATGAGPLLQLVECIDDPAQDLPNKKLIDALKVFVHWLNSPVIITIDDLHWSTTDTCNELLSLLREFSDMPVLAILSSREEIGPMSDIALYESINFSKSLIHLRPLSDEESGVLACMYTGISEEYKKQCIAQASGVPIFLVQLLSNAHGSGRELPPTLDNLIQEKLLFLSAEDRNAVKIASVIGQRFPLNVLRAVLGQDDYFPQQPCAMQLINIKRDEVNFCHELVRKGIYSQINLNTRHSLHRRIGTVFERLLVDNQDKRVLLVAHHFSEGRHSNAPYYHYLASKILTACNDYQSALNHLRQAALRIQSGDQNKQQVELEIDIQLALAAVCKVKMGWVAHPVQQAYRRAEELCRLLGNEVKLAPILLGRWVVKLMTLELDRALSIAQECRELGHKLNNEGIMLQADIALSNTLFWQGNQIAAVQAGESALGFYQQDQTEAYISEYGQDPLPLTITFTCLALSILGHKEKADLLRCNLMENPVVVQHTFSRAIALQASAWLDFHLRQPEATAKAAEELLELATEHGFPFYRGVAMMLLGWTKILLKADASGLQLIDEGFNSWIAHSGDRIAHSLYCVLLTESMLKTGNIHDAKEVVTQGIELSQLKDECCYLAELFRLRWMIAQQLQEDETQCDVYYEAAIEIAQAQHAALFIERIQSMPPHSTK